MLLTIPKHSPVYYHICIVVQETENTTTVVGFMIPQHHLLRNHHTLYNVGNASDTRTRKKKKAITSWILCPREDYKHPHNREKNCTPNFSPSLDRNSRASEIRAERDGVASLHISFTLGKQFNSLQASQSVSDLLFPPWTWAPFDPLLSLVWPSGAWWGWTSPLKGSVPYQRSCMGSRQTFQSFHF